MVARTKVSIVGRQLMQYTPYALHFKSSHLTNDALIINTNLNLTSTDWSFFFRVYFDYLGNQGQFFLTQNVVIFGLKASSPFNKFGGVISGSAQPFTTVAEKGKWYSGVVIYNSSTTKWNLYLNGVLDAITLTGAPTSSSNNHILGASTSIASGLIGSLCGCHLLKRIATVQEAINWYLTGTLPTTGTYDYKINMIEGTGNPIDTGPNGYTCTKGSAVTWVTFKPFSLGKSTLTSKRPVVRSIPNSMINYTGSVSYGSYSVNAAIQDLWTGGGTVCLWYKPGPDMNLEQTFIAADGEYGWTLRHFGARGPRLVAIFSGTSAQFRLTGTFLSNSWNFMAVSYNSDSVSNVPTPYMGQLGGELTQYTPSTATTPVGDYVSDAGGGYRVMNQSTAGRTVNGNVADVQYYNKILTITEVKAIFHDNIIPSDGSLVARWRSGSGTTLTDEIGGANITLTSATMLSTEVPLKARTVI